MRLPLHDSIVRLSVRPEPGDPAAVAGPRRGPRWVHTDAAFAAVRRLIEQSTLSYAEIRARTGVSHASICRWTRDHGWKRPPFAPRATDTIPTARASAKLKRRMLAQRLDALAERHVRELEESARVDPVKLGEALDLLKMARLAATRRPRRRPGELWTRGGVAPDRAIVHRRRRPLPRPARGGGGLPRQPRAAARGGRAARPWIAAPAGACVADGEGAVALRRVPSPRHPAET